MHIVVTATNANGEGRAICYVNGQRSPQGDWANPAQPQEPSMSPLFIGRRYVGRLDEIALYDKVLPFERVLAHYEASLEK